MSFRDIKMFLVQVVKKLYWNASRLVVIISAVAGLELSIPRIYYSSS